MASYCKGHAGGPRVSNSTHSSVTAKETSDPGDTSISSERSPYLHPSHI